MSAPRPAHMPRVCVLMSTYNGAAHLREQVDSVLGQVGCDVRLLARDDGSRDESVRILEEYALRDARVSVCAEENLGVVASFHSLLLRAGGDCGYVAFCDQDDVWFEDKLARATARLAPLGDEPAMYCSRLALVDATLRPLGLSPLAVRGPAFENALVENIATGCTVVLNRSARTLLLELLAEQDVRMHDWWAYLVLSAFGRVIYDEEPTIQYRQHGGNVVGAATGLARWRQRIDRFRSGAHRSLTSAQAAAFAARCADRLPERHRRVLHSFVSAARGGLARRLWYALTADVWRQRRLDNLVFRCLIVLGRV